MTLNDVLTLVTPGHNDDVILHHHCDILAFDSNDDNSFEVSNLGIINGKLSIGLSIDGYADYLRYYKKEV